MLEKIADGEYQVQCETPGIVGNQQLGTMIPIEYIEGLETAELTGVLIPGEDEEDTEDLRKRYFDSFNEKAFGGNVQDYLEKTNAIPGVGSTKVTRVLRNIWLLDEDVDPETGIPIGNYLSQYCGNFYLSSFDHWLKEEKRVKHTFRYMDDVVIFGSSKEELHKLRKEIALYFKTKLRLTIKGNWQIFPSYVRGVDFVGYRTFLNYTLLRKSSCKNFKAKMVKIRKKTANGQMMNYSEWCSVNSYKGWLKHCDSYRLQKKYIEPIQSDTDRYYREVVKRKVA